ncbi:MAG TPA: dTMP kinase [Nitrospirae bacterium]|nr:dTMP kinase [Nitrospirota bacterium]
MRGVFITFEGIEGSGKSTVSKMASKYLASKGFKVIHTYEPGDTAAGKEIRRILLDPVHEDMHPVTELLLCFADRAEHVHHLIAPALKMGEVVLCDRFTDSTMAYQGFGRGLDLKMLREIDAVARDGVWPELTILLDLDVRAGLQRNSHAGKKDRFEMEEIAFHERVRGGFSSIARKEPERVKVVDASRSIDAVFAEVRALIDQILPDGSD